MRPGPLFLNNRYHDPTLGTFISVDPLIATTGEPYIYAGGNPSTLSDPTGLYKAGDDPDDCQPNCWTTVHVKSPMIIPPGTTSTSTPGGSSTAGGSQSAAADGPTPPDSGSFHGSRNAQCEAGLCETVGDPTAVLFVGGFVPYVGEGIDGWDCVSGSAVSCVLIPAPIVGGRFVKAIPDWLRGADEVAEGVARACSFDGGTEVLMADGSHKPISEIEVGDAVYAFDPETGERGARLVTRLWVHEDEMLDLSVDGERVVTTWDHPFWNDTDREWQQAQQLDAGDQVLTASGATVEVGGADWSTTFEGTAYNLTVDDIHTYYVRVGDNDILVHNTCGHGVSPDRWTHIVNRHTINGIERKGASYWDDINDVGGYIDNAVSWTPSHIAGNGNVVIVVEAAQSVGWDQFTKAPTNVYTVVLNGQGAVWTAHPGLPREIERYVP